MSQAAPCFRQSPHTPISAIQVWLLLTCMKDLGLPSLKLLIRTFPFCSPSPKDPTSSLLGVNSSWLLSLLISFGDLTALPSPPQAKGLLPSHPAPLPGTPQPLILFTSSPNNQPPLEHSWSEEGPCTTPGNAPCWVGLEH